MCEGALVHPHFVLHHAHAWTLGSLDCSSLHILPFLCTASAFAWFSASRTIGWSLRTDTHRTRTRSRTSLVTTAWIRRGPESR
ncbi:hypothetical protein OH77DRAFT_606152 [Trametes cingulata]|nr:hypothetical protein OH77DRAFT_606152 [Trametes cingulata]